MASIKALPKSGIIPYFISPDGEIRMLFMVASNPRFGGPRPMISKGTIEAGEDTLTAAIREGEEELGLKRSNFKNRPFLIHEEYIELKTVQYQLAVYAVEVKDKMDFDKWDAETAFTTWMTGDSFFEKGRGDHKPIVKKLLDLLYENV